MVVNSSGAFVSRDSFEIFYDPVKNGFPFSYGINGIVGIKYNAGCYTNWFAEFSPTLQAISYFPGGNLYYSWMVRIGLRFKLNVYDLVPNKDGKAPSPFY